MNTTAWISLYFIIGIAVSLWITLRWSSVSKLYKKRHIYAEEFRYSRDIMNDILFWPVILIMTLVLVWTEKK